MQQLPEEYLEKFYGYITVSEYEYNIKLPKLINKAKYKRHVGDHFDYL